MIKHNFNTNSNSRFADFVAKTVFYALASRKSDSFFRLLCSDQ
jgi:hypothetical protein